MLDILVDVPDTLSKKYDLLVSNPPYISKNEMNYLSKEIKNFEPHIALTDFRDGLIFYHRLAELGRKIVKVNGWIILEVGLEIIRMKFCQFLKIQITETQGLLKILMEIIEY